MWASRPGETRSPVGPTLLVPGKLFGLRVWEVCHDCEGMLRLGGWGVRRKWLPHGKSTWARCDRKRDDKRAHAAPVAGCTCGLHAIHPWAFESQVSVWVPRGDRLRVIGIVEASGRVQLYREGFRAEYARPVALALLGLPADSDYGHLVARIAEGYEAQLLAVADLAELVEHCRREGLGMGRREVRSLLTPGGDGDG